MNVARASFEELLLDYEDYLRQRHLAHWPPDSEEALAVRKVPQQVKQDRLDQGGLSGLTDQERWALYAPWLESVDPAQKANALICLINQANFLLDQQIATAKRAFVAAGGYSEQLAAARLAERRRRSTDQSNQPDQTDQIPACPKCGQAMVLRTAKSGKNAGNHFWSCSDYPACKKTIAV